MAYNVPAVLYQNRFCDQKNFDLIVPEIVVDEEGRWNRKIYKVKSPSFTNVETLHSTLKYSISDLVLTSGTDIFITCIQGVEREDIDDVRSSFSKYNLNVNLINLPDKRVRYCACIFMKDLYVFGGNCDSKYIKTCFKYSTSLNTLVKVAEMKVARENAAFTVFESKIVVSGGKFHEAGKKFVPGVGWQLWDGGSNSVEAYDHHENKLHYLN